MAELPSGIVTFLFSDLEEQLGRPQDIEDGELFVLQTRPVTA